MPIIVYTPADQANIILSGSGVRWGRIPYDPSESPGPAKARVHLVTALVCTSQGAAPVSLHSSKAAQFLWASGDAAILGMWKCLCHSQIILEVEI